MNRKSKGFCLYDLPADLPAGELCEKILDGDSVRIERIVSTGQTTPPGEYYDQAEDEWVALLSGTAELTFYGPEGEESRTAMRAGDTLLIRAGQRHRVTYTSAEPPCIWLCVFGQNFVAGR